MNLAIFIGIIIVLFLVPFLLKKRFGILGLALPAGVILNDIWSYDIGLVAKTLGAPDGRVTNSILAIAIILLPAGLMMLRGSPVRKIFLRFFGSVVFAVMAVSLILDPIDDILSLQNSTSGVYYWFSENKYIVIGFGLILSLIDLIFTKSTIQVPEKSHRR